MRMNFISEGNKMLLFTSFHGVLSLKDNWNNRKKKNSGNLELIWTSMLIFSYVIRNEHRKCLKQIALSTTRKIFRDYPIHGWWNKHVAENIHSSQKERNTLVNTTKQSLFEIMSTKIKDMFNCLLFEHFFTCLLLRSKPCKPHGCIYQLYNL